MRLHIVASPKLLRSSRSQPAKNGEFDQSASSAPLARTFSRFRISFAPILARSCKHSGHESCEFPPYSILDSPFSLPLLAILNPLFSILRERATHPRLGQKLPYLVRIHLKRISHHQEIAIIARDRIPVDHIRLIAFLEPGHGLSAAAGA